MPDPLDGMSPGTRRIQQALTDSIHALRSQSAYCEGASVRNGLALDESDQQDRAVDTTGFSEGTL